MNHITIRIVDEVNIIIQGLTATEYNELSDMFAVYTKGYMHQAKFKLGQWDGKIRFFKKNGESYLKLLPEILDYLKLSYKTEQIKLIDNRKYYDLSIPPIDDLYLKRKGFDIVLGEHQVRGVNALLAEGGGIFEGGTGAGKTLMTAILCHLYEEHLGYKCIIIVPTSDLIDQTRAELDLYGVDIGVYGGASKDINHAHLVSTWQSLQNNKGLIGQYHVTIVDECHGVSGSVLREILNTHGANCRVRMGLTGTLPEEPIDQMAVRITMGHVVECVEASELIASGWLAELKLYCYELTEDVKEQYETFCREEPDKAVGLTYKKFKTNFFKDYVAEKKFIQRRPERLDFLAKLIFKPVKNTLVLVPNIAFGRALAKLIPGAVFFYGKDSTAVRKELYKSFDDNDDITAITTYSLGSTGLNIKRIFYLFLIDAGKSYIQIIQSIGRGLRKAIDKDKVSVYDVHSDFKFSKRHASRRKKHYDKKNYPYKPSSVDYMALLK